MIDCVIILFTTQCHDIAATGAILHHPKLRLIPVFVIDCSCQVQGRVGRKIVAHYNIVRSRQIAEWGRLACTPYAVCQSGGTLKRFLEVHLYCPLTRSLASQLSYSHIIICNNLQPCKMGFVSIKVTNDLKNMWESFERIRYWRDLLVNNHH